MTKLLRWLWMSDVFERTPRLAPQIRWFRLLSALPLCWAGEALLIHHSVIGIAIACLLICLFAALIHGVENRSRHP